MATTTTPKPTIDTGIAAHLETILAESYALLAQSHLAHWNVEGDDFFQLHSAFEEHYTELFEAVDTLAEHLRANGVYSPGGLDMLSSLSAVPESKDRQMTAKDWVAHLAEGHAILIDHARDGRKAAAEAGDAETEDLIIERIQVHEKTLWMLKSYLK